MRRIARQAALGLVLLAAALPGRAEDPPAGGQVARAVEPVEEAPYDPTGRRDPFRPPGTGMAKGSPDEPRSPLQSFEIGQLRLVAIIYNTREPRAVLEDDQGLGYIVRVGTPIGLNDGRVRTIERGRVVVQENTSDFYGEMHPTDVVLELRTGERGKR